MTVGTPFIAHVLYFVCNEGGCPASTFLENPLAHLAAQWPGLNTLFSLRIFAYYCAWYFGLAALQFALPGRERLGVELRDGSRLKYKLNGASAPAPAADTPLTAQLPRLLR